MIQYYTNVEHTAVYRFNEANPEYYDLLARQWKPCPELWDIYIGEFDVDELTEDEANKLIASLFEKRKQDLPLMVKSALRMLYREPPQ